MVDLWTNYLGIILRNPLLVSNSGWKNSGAGSITGIFTIRELMNVIGL
jgi:hypothetical protein